MTQKQYNGTTVNDIYSALHKKFNWLVDEILKYESDTFSSEATNLTAEEAERIATIFILQDIVKRIDHDTMDGGMISDELDSIRLVA